MVHFRPVENSYENLKAKIEVKFLTGVVEKCEHYDRLNFCMDAWLLSWKKRERLQTDMANMDL